MKDTLFLALIILAAFPASAQKTASPGRSNSDGASASVQDYAACVDGLLRDVHASLQKISEDAAAGRLTPEQAEKSKLAATRDAISHLDAIAAIYDARPISQEKPDTKTGAAAGADKVALANSRGTVSVEELKRESAAARMTPSAAQGSR